MLRKKEAYTVVTPIPGFIPRQLALDILHAHSEVITLNPLVLEHHPISAPRNAAADEYYSTWYEIIERIQYLPGAGKMGSGKITFNGCFHDMPWGLQTHIYAPMNIDLRNRYRIGGNQPGIEPPEHREIGLENLGTPKDGLYLREDIEIKCNIAMVSFVKAQLKTASKEMVQRIIKKAELLDAGVLQGMMQDGRLKTLNPNDRSTLSAEKAYADLTGIPRHNSVGPSRHNSVMGPGSPGPYGHPGNSPSFQYARPDTASSHGYVSPNPYHHGQGTPPPPHMPMAPGKEQVFAMELPGDTYHAQPSPGLQPPQPSPGMASQWSQSQHSPSLSDPHRMSSSSMSSSGGGYPSPANPGHSFAAELPAHTETAEEYQSNTRR